MRVNSFPELQGCTALVARLSSVDTYDPVPGGAATKYVTGMVRVLAAGAESAVNHVVGVDGDSERHVKVALGGERELLYGIYTRKEFIKVNLRILITS